VGYTETVFKARQIGEDGFYPVMH